MKYSHLLALSTVALIGLNGASAFADTYNNSHNGAGFTSHHLVDAEPYERQAENLPADEKLELREFLDYEQREPCQFYQPIPQGFMKDGCHVVPIEAKKVVQVQKQAPAPQPVKVSNVLSDYEINFAFDSSKIEPAAGNTLDTIANEIKTYQPREVTVVGHTDKAGPNDYNQKLSERRANAVSNALTERGITNRILDQNAVGESQPAVQTPDGQPLRENRRVVVEFRK